MAGVSTETTPLPPQQSKVTGRTKGPSLPAAPKEITVIKKNATAADIAAATGESLDGDTKRTTEVTVTLNKTAPKDPKHIRELIDNLNNNAFRTREAASSELRNLGPAAAEELHKAGTIVQDPEQRTYSLEQVMRISALIRNLKISISGKATLKEIFTEISEQTGFAIHTGDVANDLVSVNIKNKSVKEVIDMLCESTSHYQASHRGGVVIKQQTVFPGIRGGGVVGPIGPVMPRIGLPGAGLQKFQQMPPAPQRRRPLPPQGADGADGDGE